MDAFSTALALLVGAHLASPGGQRRCGVWPNPLLAVARRAGADALVIFTLIVSAAW